MFDLKLTPKSIQNASESNDGMRIYARSGENPEIQIMDDIGEDMFGNGISSKEIVGFLDSHKTQTVKARFNSYGGDAFEGLVIHNAFQQHGNVEATIDGIAFSAASIAASGAKRLLMNEASSFGIHRSWTVAAGNSNNLQAAIEWLESVDNHQINIFANRTGKSIAQVTEWLEGSDDGTVFNASDAVRHGFADEVIPLRNQRETTAAKATNHAFARMKLELMRQL